MHARERVDEQGGMLHAGEARDGGATRRLQLRPCARGTCHAEGHDGDVRVGVDARQHGRSRTVAVDEDPLRPPCDERQQGGGAARRLRQRVGGAARRL